MISKNRYYLKVGKAEDLENYRERLIYRILEILPGALAWATLLGVIFLSWYRPIWVAVFIIVFDVYWLLKTVYLSIHLRASYKRMKKQMKVNWASELTKLREKEGKDWRDVYHLVILPVSKESFDVIQEALDAIIQSDYPKEQRKSKMIIVLSFEERGLRETKTSIAKSEKEYGDKFYKFITTVHPDGIKGELAAKGANITWAGRRAKEVIDSLKINYSRVVVSCFDIDTRVYPKYFSCLTYHYLTAENPTRTSYQPVPVYNNNIWQAPAISRVVATSGTFWQMMQQQRPERLSTFSSQAISFKALVEVDFWPTNIVSEDSRIFWQNFLFYNGKYHAVPLNYPVSMDANLADNFFGTALNVYRQQRRWGWGVENIPYLLFGFLKSGRNISLKTKLHWAFVQLEGFWSWGTNALMIFLLGWLPLFLGGDQFNITVISYHLPRITRFLMTLAMVGLVGSAIYSTMLLPKRPKQYGAFRQFVMIVQWVLIPFTIVIFGSFPGLEAQTRLMIGKYMGFWVTPKKRAFKPNKKIS